jgi:glucans biosynthesis protein
VFLGASFFRLLGARQSFGTSARALAIDTAEPSGEEFPRFTEFWIETPGQAADVIRLYALLESPRVAGAYEFTIRPGDATVADVGAVIYLRGKVAKLGLAPLTSMFLYGENTTRCHVDYRPEVHDADGLLLQGGGGDWLWRPLRNPERNFALSEFPGASAFGLLQRDREFEHYEDLEAHYEDRPSTWVVPGPAWPVGHVELLEIPTQREGNDNVVALWIPDRQPDPGQELRLGYEVRAFRASPDLPASALLRVRGTRLQPGEKSGARYLVDFAGGVPPIADRDTVTAGIEPEHARVENLVVQRNDRTGGWRVFFDVIPERGAEATVRLRLLQGTAPRSETWVYRVTDH